MGRIEYKVGDIVVIKKNPCGFKKYSVTEVIGFALVHRGYQKPIGKELIVRCHAPSLNSPNNTKTFINNKYILCKANEREQFLYHILGIYQSTDRIRSKQLAYKWRSVRGRMLDEA